jgi:hypothetical protein
VCSSDLLQVFLETWCSRRWNARLLGGRGRSAVPYLHVEDLLTFLVRVVERNEELGPAEVLQASPDGCTSHAELFAAATRSFFGAPRRPLYAPVPLARLGIRAREALGRVTGRMPFERSWMGDYIDRRLEVDAARTRRRIDWAPNPELGVLRRLPVLVGHLRDRPAEWERWNALRRKVRIAYERAPRTSARIWGPVNPSWVIAPAGQVATQRPQPLQSTSLTRASDRPASVTTSIAW